MLTSSFSCRIQAGFPPFKLVPHGWRLTQWSDWKFEGIRLQAGKNSKSGNFQQNTEGSPPFIYSSQRQFLDEHISCFMFFLIFLFLSEIVDTLSSHILPYRVWLSHILQNRRGFQQFQPEAPITRLDASKWTEELNNWSCTGDTITHFHLKRSIINTTYSHDCVAYHTDKRARWEERDGAACRAHVRHSRGVSCSLYIKFCESFVRLQ